MRVIYDISVLGRGFYIPRDRTGIFRVIENLARELVLAEVITSFSSTRSVISYFECMSYLQSDVALSGVTLLKPHVHEGLLGIFQDRHKRINMGSATSFYMKLMGRLVNNRIADRTFARSIMKPSDLEAVDVYHSPFYPFPEQIKNCKKLKKVITIYDLIPILYPNFFQSGQDELIRNVLKSIDKNTWVTCISQATKNDLCNLQTSLDPSRVFVTYLAASSMFYRCQDRDKLEQTRKKFGIPDGSYILSLSTLEPRKNITQTIRCFNRLVEEDKTNDLSLVLVGTKGWDFDSIFSEIAVSPKIRDRIIVTGYAADEDLASLYSGAMMFVYPSFYEGFGLPPLEAMQCGIPVITSNTSSLPEVVGDAGIMVDPQDADELCEAMLKIYNSSDVRNQMSLASLEQAKKFSWERCAEQTIAAYKAAIAG